MKRTFNTRSNALKALKDFSSEAVKHAKELLTEVNGKFIFDEDAAEKYLQNQEDITHNAANVLENTMNVKTATAAQLVAFYNEHADTPIKKFRDRATAEKRCQELLDLAASNEPAPEATPAPKKDDGFLANTVAFAKNREEEKASGKKDKKEKSMLKSLLNPKPAKVVPAPVVKKEEPKAPTKVLLPNAMELLKNGSCPYCGDEDNGLTFDDEPGKETEYLFCHICSTSFSGVDGHLRPERKVKASGEERTQSVTQAETMKTSLKLDRTIIAVADGKELGTWKNAYQLWKQHPDWMTSAQQDGLTAKLYKAAKEGQRITVEINGRSFYLANVG